MSPPDYKKIYQVLQLQHEGAQDKRKYLEAARIAKECLLNIEWVQELARLSESHESCEQWIYEAQSEYTRKFELLRQQNYDASQSLNAEDIAEVMLEEGHLQVLRGSYREAYIVYMSARNTWNEVDVKGLFFSCQIDVIQQNWSMLYTAVSKALPEIPSSDKYFTDLVIDLVLAAWSLAHYSDCLALLLSLDLLGTHSAWLSEENLVCMATTCALLTFDRANLTYFAHDDSSMAPLVRRYPYVAELVDSFLALDIKPFWQHWRKLLAHNQHHLFLTERLFEQEKDIRKALQLQYLLLWQRDRLSHTLRELSHPESNFTITQLLDLVSDCDFKLEIDMIEDTLVVTACEAFPEKAEELAYMYIRNALMRIWRQRGANFRAAN